MSSIKIGLLSTLTNGIHNKRKKAEQAADREAIKSARKAGQDVDGGGGDKRSGVEVD